MSRWGWGKPSTVTKTKSLEDQLIEYEMCDVCGKSFLYTYIRRVTYLHPRGTLYTIRCCPYCNPQTLIPFL